MLSTTWLTLFWRKVIVGRPVKKPCMLPHIWRNAKKSAREKCDPGPRWKICMLLPKKKICFFVYSHLFPTWLPLCIKVVVGSSEICWHGVQKICIKLIILKTEFEQKTCYTTTLFSIHFMFYIGILWYYGGPMGLNIIFYHANPWPVSGASGDMGRKGWIGQVPQIPMIWCPLAEPLGRSHPCRPTWMEPNFEELWTYLVIIIIIYILLYFIILCRVDIFWYSNIVSHVYMYIYIYRVYDII